MEQEEVAIGDGRTAILAPALDVAELGANCLNICDTVLVKREHLSSER